MPNNALAPLLASLLLALPACQRPADDVAVDNALGLAPAAFTAADAIDAERLRSIVADLSSDDFGGRGPASEGDTKTQAYLAGLLEAMGYLPGGENGDWLQPLDIVSLTTTAPESWRFEGTGDSLRLAFWDDFIATSGVQAPTAAIDGAELVFVGYGIRAPEHDWDDYKGLDVRGKVLLMLNNDPDWDDDLFEGTRRLYYGRWDYKYEIAGELGAAGAIIIHTTPSAGYPYQVVQTSWTGPQFELPAAGQPTTPVEAWVTEDAAHRLAALAGHDLEAMIATARSRDFEPIELGVTTSLQLDVEVSSVRTANVAGLLEGSDPELKDEVVVYTAHHDHLGVGTPDDEGDAIYNGALDNASGVAQVAAIGAAFKALPEPPRRSVLLLFVAAEEQGLLGSEYYARRPTFHPGQIAANINLDGGNIWGRTRDLTYIGYGKSSLDAVVDAAAAIQGRTVLGDQFPDRGFFYRSDQFNFAKIGVPAIYIDSGTDFVDRPEGWGKEQLDRWVKEDYHQPSDEYAEDWDLSGAIEDIRLLYLAGLRIANDDDMPSWNPGDEFEAARKQAIAEAP